METLSSERLKYLTLLSKKYPTVQHVCTEIINLQAILNLPKGTEHFMSDLHGEYESFTHILNNCSGVIREKVETLYADTLSAQERSELCTLIYYPDEKLRQHHNNAELTKQWYLTMLHRLIDLCKIIASKYTRSKVRKALPEGYSYIIDELLHAQPEEDTNQSHYHQKILETLIDIENGDDFIIALSTLIKRLAVDRLHIVGDVFDRGPHADRILDMLEQHHCVDIEWGNHDILWMGAAAGNNVCIAATVRNSLHYQTREMLENGYGISLTPLLLFAQEQYPHLPPLDAALYAITLIMFKLEGQLIKRHPEYQMDDYLLLDQIDFESGTVLLQGKQYPVAVQNFCHLSAQDPYTLTEQEQEVLENLKNAFLCSDRLQRHIRFLYAKGSLYRCFNQNLLFHGCVPLDEEGNFKEIILGNRRYAGKSYFDFADLTARQAYFAPTDDALDFMWFLWCSENSPLCGRKLRTFARTFIQDKSTWVEPQNSYYTNCRCEKTCRMILTEFGLCEETSHIINGHTPIHASEGENPVKAKGKLIIIDGGFCRFYQRTTGIAGYTLIYNSHALRIMSHQAFGSIQSALFENSDIHSDSMVIEKVPSRVMVMDTDNGLQIQEDIKDLTCLLKLYRQGVLKAKD